MSQNRRHVRFLYLFLLSTILIPFQNCGAPESAKYGTSTSTSSSTVGDGSGGGGVGATSKPAAPSQLQVTSPASNQAKLTWIDNSNNETGFTVERASTVSSGPFTPPVTTFSVISITDADTTTYIDTGIQPSATYTYRVSATNGMGSSPTTAEISVNTPAAPVSLPSPPANLMATPTAATIVNLNWTDNSNNEFGFKIEQSLNGTTFTQIATVSTNATSYQAINLNPATQYTFRVRAFNNIGDSANTAVASATTLAAGNTATYNYISVNILAGQCVGCHSAANKVAGVDVSTYNATLGIVTKGNSGGSLLYTDIINGRMPPGAPLSASQISAIKNWIDGGALNN
jgi:hypothetical protein